MNEVTKYVLVDIVLHTDASESWKIRSSDLTLNDAKEELSAIDAVYLGSGEMDITTIIVEIDIVKWLTESIEQGDHPAWDDWDDSVDKSQAPICQSPNDDGIACGCCDVCCEFLLDWEVEYLRSSDINNADK